MDITPNSNNNNNNNNIIKANESEFELASRVKPLAFTNGVLKRTNNNSSELSVPIVVHYRECLKNHAANLGGHALDGCGEFMPSPSATASDPTSLKCAACGCHRNFHRRDHDDSLPLTPRNAVIEYQPHHRHRPPPPSNGGAGSPSSLSPPPISSSYPASAPHMLLALSDGLLGPQNNHSAPIAQIRAHPSGRKRFRTKFTQQQKERMFGFAERVGWKIQKRDENEIIDFCNEIGVDRGVLKVWMHNNKSTLGKRDTNNISLTNNNGGIGNISYNINIGELEDQKQPPPPQQIINNTNNNLSSDSTGSPAVNVGTNGNASSSSS